MNSTPLHGAAWGGHIECVKILCEFGADPFALNKVNDTPLDDSKTDEIREYILHYQELRKPISQELLYHNGNKINIEDIPTIIINKNGNKRIRIVCLSDTHNFRSFTSSNIPNGDILIHSGDFTDRGSKEEHEEFKKQLQSMPHTYKIIVAGNHDFLFDTLTQEKVQSFYGDSCIYLRDNSINIMGITFYGSPWTPIGMSFHARGEKIDSMFNRIPDNTDILITHSPPYNILDLAWQKPTPKTAKTELCLECNTKHPLYFKHWGVKSLKNRVLQVQPKIHQFGHVHDDGYAAVTIPEIDTIFLNASVDLKKKVISYDVIV